MNSSPERKAEVAAENALQRRVEEVAAENALLRQKLDEVLAENRVLKRKADLEAIQIKGLNAGAVVTVEEWAARLVHDVKSPFGLICMAMDFLLQRCPPGSDTDFFFKEIKTALDRSRSIMKALGSPLETGAGEEDVSKG